MRRITVLCCIGLLLAPGLLFAGGAAEEEVVAEEEFLGFPRSDSVIFNQLTGRVGAPDNFNEWVGWKWRDRGMAQVMNEALWTVDYVTGEVINGLAAAPPDYSNDFTRMTVDLREGVYWSDGVELTSEDVAFTIEYLKAHDGMNYHAQFQIVDSVSTPDRYTVVVELSEADSRFHTFFLDRWGSCFIMPKHVFEDVDNPIAFEYNEPLSNGPYVLHSYDPDGYWTGWERRDDWERTPTGMLYGEPAPQYVVFRHAGSPTTQVMSVADGQLDVAVPITIEAMHASLEMDEYARTFYPDFPWADNFDPAITGLSFNTLREPYDNPDVRWALTLAIDAVSLSETAFDGATLMSALLTPTLPLHNEHYYEPLQEWLEEFTLDIGGGETFQPYDPDVPYRLAEFAEGRGYNVPEDVIATFGWGWWKHAPDVAERLLESNGFSRNARDQWLLPNGEPWRINLVTGTEAGHPGYQNAFAAAHEWREFGIDVNVNTSEMQATLQDHGQFDVATGWPAYEPWGGHPDLFRTFNHWNSDYVEPELGQLQHGHISRWSHPEMDEIIRELRRTDWTDHERIAELGREGLKLAVQEMPGIATYNYVGPEVKSTRYWTNWPTAENPYNVSLTHWPNLKYMLPFLESTGR